MVYNKELLRQNIRVMEKNKKEEKRIRRDKETIENNILNATKSLIETNGFSKITTSAIIQKADILPAVFYYRYNDIEDLFDKFTRNYDYWVNDVSKFDPNLPAYQNWENVLINLIDAIDNDPIMKQLLLWELNEDNWITRRTSENRERFTKELRGYFEEAFKDNDIDYSLTTSVIIGGIYYLTLFKGRSTLLGINLSKKSDMNDFKNNLRLVLRKICDKKTRSSESDLLTTVARRMIDKGIKKQLIIEITGLTEDRINSLIPEGYAKPRKRGRPRKIRDSD